MMKERDQRFVRVLIGQMFLRTEQFLPYMAEANTTMDNPVEKIARECSDAELTDCGEPRRVPAFRRIEMLLVDCGRGWKWLWANGAAG